MTHEESPFTFTTLLAGKKGVDLGKYTVGVSALEREWYPNEPVVKTEDEDTLKSDGCVAVVLALNEERVVGFGTLTQLEDGEMILDSAFVTESFRRRGIYKQLVRERVEIARQQGAESILLAASETNMAKGWIAEFGFSTRESNEDGSWVEFEMKL